MGLKNREGGNYVRLREGKFYLGNDKEKPFDELEGVITDMSFKNEEYEGTPIRKFVVKIKDEEGQTYILSIRQASAYFSSLIGFLKNADLTRTLTLIPILKEIEDKKKYSILVRQDGTFMKQYYTKDNPHGLPQMKKVKVSGKILWDTEDYSAFLENVVETELKTQLTGDSESTERTIPTPTKKTSAVMSDTSDEDVDDLPF